MKCPNCGADIKIEYDIWNQSYWICYKCGLRSSDIVIYRDNTESSCLQYSCKEIKCN